MVRIVAGTARGRKLETLQGLDTRPTLDRVKEAAFGSLQFAIPYSTVLDLFSGSGNLGLEAASRGAAHVVLNDSNPACTAIIARNAAALGLTSTTRILQADYLTAIALLAAEGASFDIVFLDAPYHEGQAQKAAHALFSRGMVKRGGTVMLEHATDCPPVAEDGLSTIRKTKHYGTCSFSLLEGIEPS